MLEEIVTIQSLELCKDDLRREGVKFEACSWRREEMSSSAVKKRWGEC